MDPDLAEIRLKLRKETRVRMWRPPKELRAEILRWASVARGRGMTWSEIALAVEIDPERLKAWQRAAGIPGSGKRGALQMTPVVVEPLASQASQGGLTVWVLRGVTVNDIAQLVAALP